MEEILQKKKPNQKTCDILLDSTLKGQIDQLEKELNRVSRGTHSLGGRTPATIQQEIDRLYDQAHESTVTFTFRDIGRKAYDDLISDHPPTPEQKTDYKNNGGEGTLAYNTETFPPALISACSTEPKISLEQATLICDDWSEGDITTMFFAALAACKERTTIPFGRSVSAATADSDLNLNTVLSGESPTPSS